MKKSVKFLSLFLSAVMGCSMILSACNEEESSSVATVDTVTPVSYTDGIHDFTAPQADGYIVKNGSTEYRLVLPETQDEFLTVAEEEFVFFFEQATGIKIPVIKESGDGLTHSKEAKYISIGNTKLLASAGLAADESVLGSQGVKIKTVDDSIYLYGGGQQGALYAVYDFLQIVFNWEIYYYDVWEMDENVKNVPMRNFDVTDIPDIELRSASWGPVHGNIDNAGYRFRMQIGGYSQQIIPLGDTEHGQLEAEIHNSDNIIPKAYWYDKHPAWFADSGGQICYTAHGDPEEYEELLNQATKVIVSGMNKYPKEEFPQYKYICFMIEDDASSCTCNACNNSLNLYGANSGAMVIFCNDLMEKVQEEIVKPENSKAYREDIKLLFFAYMRMLNAPVRYDSIEEEYAPIHPDLQLREDVGVFYAINRGIMNYIIDVYDDSSDEGRNNLEKWHALAKDGGGMYFWTYCTVFTAYQFYLDSFNHFTSEGYQYYVAYDAKLFYNQGERQNKDLTNFDGLKMYLDAKLQWDCTLDEKVLIDNWFNAMYGSVAPMMKEFWGTQREWSILIYDKIGRLDKFSYNPQMFSSSVFEYAPLLNFLEQCNDIQRVAYEMYGESDPKTYEKIKRNIDLEWVPFAYMLLKLYGDSLLPSDRIESIKTYFYSLESTLNEIRERESSTMSVFKEIKNTLG